MKIAFIGFGEAAQAFVGSLRETGELTVSAYDIALGTPAGVPLRQAAERLGVVAAETPAVAVRGADWLVSAVTAAESLDAARSVAGALHEGQVFFDINSVSGARKLETAALIERGGARYVDMAVMAPVHPRGHRTPALLAGNLDEATRRRLEVLDFDFEHIGPEVGIAASIKMVRSLFVKGLEAITVQAFLAAREAGCLERVLASLSSSFPEFGWPVFATYRFERVATHGVRRAAEMRECASAMRELGLSAGGLLADAIAGVEEETGTLKVELAPDVDLQEAIDAVRLSARTSRR